MLSPAILSFVVSLSLADNSEHPPGIDSFPWYDVQTRGVKRVDVEPQDSFDDRTTRWKSTPFNWSLPNGVADLIEVLMWIGATILCLVLVYYLLKALSKAEIGVFDAGASPPTVSVDAEDVVRVESLPFRLHQPTANLLDEARRSYESGDFNRAIVYQYSYMLVELDRNQKIRLSRGKTNRQYLRETKREPQLYSVLRRCMIAFEDVFFGGEILERDRFEQCWQEVPGFLAFLKQGSR